MHSINWPPRRLVVRLWGGRVISTSNGSRLWAPAGIWPETRTTALLGDARSSLTLEILRRASSVSRYLDQPPGGAPPPVPSRPTTRPTPLTEIDSELATLVTSPMVLI